MKSGAVADVEAMEFEIGFSFELREPPVLKANIVSIVEIVDTNDTVGMNQEEFCNFPADEAGSSRDQYSRHS